LWSGRSRVQIIKGVIELFVQKLERFLEGDVFDIERLTWSAMLRTCDDDADARIGYIDVEYEKPS